MNRILLSFCAILAGSSLFLSAGCAQQKTSSPTEAIQASQALKTVQEKASYLMQQAQAFYNSKEYKQAIETAQYVLNNLDKNSQAAKDLIAKAKVQLQAVAQKAMGDASSKFLGK